MGNFIGDHTGEVKAILFSGVRGGAQDPQIFGAVTATEQALFKKC